MTSTTLINGYEHYLTSDGTRTFVGPVHHRATKRLTKARAAIAAKFNRSKETSVTHQDQPTTVIPAVEVDDPNATTQNIAKIGDHVTKMLEGLKLPTFHVNPPKPDGYKGKKAQSRWAEAKEAVLDRVYDDAWHTAIQNTCKTVGYVAMTTTSVVVFAKALVWVVLL